MAGTEPRNTVLCNFLKKKLYFHLLINIIKDKLLIMAKEHHLGLIGFYIKKMKVLNVYFMIQLICIFLIISH